MQKQTSVNDNSYRHYNLPLVFPCMTFFGDQWVLDDDVRRIPHFHNCIELGYCKSGRGSILVENHEFPFHQGQYSFIAENVTHKFLAAPGTDSQWEYIYFDPYLLLRNVLPQEDPNRLLTRLIQYFGIIEPTDMPDLFFLMERIFTVLHEKKPYYQDSLKGFFLSLLLLAERNSALYHETESDFRWLYSAISFIRRNYGQKLSIAEIAETCCNLSESHFRKKFTQTMHITPLEYINHLRIRIACQAIYHNEKPINETASDVGFSTLSSFNRNFQALLHCSPSEWRKQQTSDREALEILSVEANEAREIFIR